MPEDEHPVQRDVQKAAADVDDGDRQRASLPGEERVERRGGADEHAARQQRNEIVHLAADQLGIVVGPAEDRKPENRDYECDEEAGGDGDRLPGPHRAQQVLPVVRPVVLRNHGRREVAGDHEKAEQREVQDAGRHGGGDVERRVMRQEPAVDELHDAVARAHDDERISDPADFEIAAAADEITAVE